MDNKIREKTRNNRRCIIYCCNSSSLKDKNLKFFRFPLPETPDYQIWLSACKDSYNQIRVLKKPLICSLHFIPEEVGGRRLTPGAFPKIRLTANKDVIDSQMRDKKIKFLNKVMVEWLVRNRPHREIYGKQLIEKAREARDLLEIPSYIPDKSWLKNFNEEIADPSSRLFGKLDTSGASLGMADVIRELLQIDEMKKQSQQDYSGAENSIEISDDDDDYDDGDFSDSYADLSSKLEVSVTVDEDKDFYEPSMKMPKLQSISLNLDEDDESKKNIESYKEALNYMKPLEDFALQVEDFRAIGLLAQLDAIFKLQQ